MAEDKASGGTSYGQVVADGQSTVTLASALVSLVGRPLSGLWAKKSAADDYRARLGEWADEARDARGRWLQPVLRAAAFEDHLVREEGRPKPSKPGDSSLAWAQLLYALNVRPGMGVLAWRLPPKAVDPGVEVARLLVDGAAMCHIINLFRVYDEAAPVSFSPDVPVRASDSASHAKNICKFPFGTLSVDTTPVGRPRDVRFVATFEPRSREELQLERLPLSHDSWFLKGTHLAFERSSLMAKYFSGVQNQVPVADTASLGPLPAPSDSLKTRAEYYVRSTKLLRSLHECGPRCVKSCIFKVWHGGEPCAEGCKQACELEDSVEWDKPRLVTQVWLNEIERIKRRVMANGGDDTGFLDFLMKSLEERPQFVQHAKHVLSCVPGGMHPDDTDWKSEAQHELRSRLMFKGHHIVFPWSQSPGSLLLHLGEFRMHMVEEVEAILADLPATNSDGGWLQQLSSLTDEVRSMISKEDAFHNVPVLVLELGPSHPFWKDMFEIKGE